MHSRTHGAGKGGPRKGTNHAWLGSRPHSQKQQRRLVFAAACGGQRGAAQGKVELGAIDERVIAVVELDLSQVQLDAISRRVICRAYDNLAGRCWMGGCSRMESNVVV